MKTIFKLFVVLLFPMLIASCSDNDKNLPDVQFSFDLEGVKAVDGLIYAVQDSVFEVSAINVTNVEAGKYAAIKSATYYWDNFYIGATFVSPYGIKFPISLSTPLGPHTLTVEMPVLAEDKSVAMAYVTLRVVVVADESDIPTEGDTSITTTAEIKS